jgi:hypothetical protein
MSWSISADGANRAQVLAQFAERIAASDGTPKDGANSTRSRVASEHERAKGQ